MTVDKLLALIDERVAKDAAFAKMVSDRDDAGVAAALSEGRVRARQYLITRRGLRRVLGAHEGRVFVQALREVAALAQSLPEAHPVFDDVWWLAEILPDIGGDGIDIGDYETRAGMRGLVTLCALLDTPHKVTTGHCDTLEAASNEPDPISWVQVAEALGSR